MLFRHEGHPHPAQSGLAEVREEGQRDARYAEYVRRCFIESQRQASRQVSAITLRLMRQADRA